MSAGGNAPNNVSVRKKWRCNLRTCCWDQYALLDDGSLGARIGPPEVKSASVAAAGKAATAVGSVAAARVDRSCGDGAASGSGAAAAPGSGARKAAGNGAAAAVGIEQRLPVAVMATQPAIVNEQRPTVSAMAPQATEVMGHRPAVAVKAPPPKAGIAQRPPGVPPTGTFSNETPALPARSADKWILVD
jgi:hypothetical protein